MGILSQLANLEASIQHFHNYTIGILLLLSSEIERKILLIKRINPTPIRVVFVYLPKAGRNVVAIRTPIQALCSITFFFVLNKNYDDLKNFPKMFGPDRMKNGLDQS